MLCSPQGREEIPPVHRQQVQMEVLSVIVTYPKVPLVDKLKLTNIVWVWPGKRISDMVQSTRKKSRAVSASVESRALPFPTQQSGFLLMTNIITCAHWASQICVCMRLFLHSSFVASFWDKFESFPLTTKAPPRTFVFSPMTWVSTHHGVLYIPCL